MVLQRWYPIGDIGRIEDRLWRGFGFGPSVRGRVNGQVLPLDVEETDNEVVVRASIPGVNPEDVEVTIDNDVLTIEGKAEAEAEAEAEREEKEGSYLVRERRSGAYHRSIRLPDTVDAENAVSSYERGVLSVSFPKLEAKKARHIEVQVKS